MPTAISADIYDLPEDVEEEEIQCDKDTHHAGIEQQHASRIRDRPEH